MQLSGGSDACLGRLALRIKGGALMGILAIAHVRALVELQIDSAWEIATRVVLVETAQVVGDGAVVACRMLENLGRQMTPGGAGYRTIVMRNFVHHQ